VGPPSREGWLTQLRDQNLRAEGHTWPLAGRCGDQKKPITHRQGPLEARFVLIRGNQVSWIVSPGQQHQGLQPSASGPRFNSPRPSRRRRAPGLPHRSRSGAGRRPASDASGQHQPPGVGRVGQQLQARPSSSTLKRTPPASDPTDAGAQGGRRKLSRRCESPLPPLFEGQPDHPACPSLSVVPTGEEAAPCLAHQLGNWRNSNRPAWSFWRRGNRACRGHQLNLSIFG